jgi:GNAT superfamily N-acetyltransferase
MEASIVRLREIRDHDLLPLLDASESEGFRFVRRVFNEWKTGANRFGEPGEALFGAFANGQLVGICGLMADPYAQAEGVGRLRNLYVLPAWRRHGVGRRLVEATVNSAKLSFHLLRLRAGTPSAARFYDGLGFGATASEPDSTHILTLSQEPSSTV